MAKHSCSGGRLRHLFSSGTGIKRCVMCGYTPPPPNTQEKDLQKVIVDFLTLEGWRVFEFNKPGAGVYRLPKINPQDPTEKQQWRSVRGGTVPEDWPDIAAFRGQYGQILMLLVEVKIPGRVSTPGQIEFREWIWARGGLFFEIESLEDLARGLVAVGFELRFYTLEKEVKRA